MRSIKVFIWLVSVLGVSSATRAGNWSEWRGPQGNGHAASGEVPVTEWNESRNVIWKTRLPGNGHSSPTIPGNQIILTTSDVDKQTQSVLSIDRSNGEKMWETVVHRDHLPERIHKNNTHASPTAVTDGENIFVVFYNGTSVYVSSLDFQGELLWQARAGAFESRYPFGYGASPVIHGDNVIVSSEYEDGGYIAAFSKRDGHPVWQIPRVQSSSYSTPVVGNVAGRDQLLISGQSRVSSFDPKTGRELWHVSGSSPATCGTMVWSEDAVFASGGFPNKETIAVKADGSGEVLWKNGNKSYEQSLIYVDGHIYTLNDTGIAYCWDARTGEEKWKVRLGGPVSSSPVYANGLIYAGNERGITYVFRANPDSYQQVAVNQLGESMFATPSFVDNRIYIRTAYNRATREEWLYCIGQK